MGENLSRAGLLGLRLSGEASGKWDLICVLPGSGLRGQDLGSSERKGRAFKVQ